MKTINTRRTIRKYATREVENELLHRLLAEAERTQTMGNLQFYSVIVTRDDEMKRRLAPAHFCQPMVTEAPVVLTFCADTRRTTKWAECRDANPGFSNFLSFMNGATDALLYCQTFCNLAEEEGLGCCFLGTTVYSPQTIIDVLQLPPLVMPVATITLGWPDETPDLTERLPLEAVMHEEVYHDYTPQLINRFYELDAGEITFDGIDVRNMRLYASRDSLIRKSKNAIKGSVCHLSSWHIDPLIA